MAGTYSIKALTPARFEGDTGFTYFDFVVTRNGTWLGAGTPERVFLSFDSGTTDVLDNVQANYGEGALSFWDNIRFNVGRADSLLFTPGMGDHVFTVRVAGDCFVEADEPDVRPRTPAHQGSRPLLGLRAGPC
jgi:hypothetical protein